MEDLDEEIRALQQQRKLQDGRAATFGKAGDFDSDIYGQHDYVSSINVNEDEDEQAFEDSRRQGSSSVRRLVGSYTAPKNVLRDIPTDADADPFAEHRVKKIVDRENDYKKRRFKRQLSPPRDGSRSYREIMAEQNLDREHERVLQQVEKKKKEQKAEMEKQMKERREQLRREEKERRKLEKEKRKEERRKRKRQKRGEDDSGDSNNEEAEVKEEEENEEDDPRMAAWRHKQPPEARKPEQRYVLHTFKAGTILGDPIPVHKKSVYRFGRDAELNDIVTAHESCSKQHAVLQYREVEVSTDDASAVKQVRPFLMDLGSTNGTSLNDKKVEANQYHELKEGDAIKLGFSTRSYVLQLERYRRK
ncbi:hypothetical protein QOT17_000792 [Balamuthia mandrillaris]